MSTVVITPDFGVRRPVRRPADAPPLRLTRRGRVVATLVFLALALAVLAVLGPGSAATDEAGRPEPTRLVMVQSGDTLWDIAATVAAPGEVREMVHHIEQLNALSGAELSAGQQIAVPAS